MTDAILWWTGAVVWALVGGSLIMTLVCIAAMIVSFVTYRMAMSMLKDIGGLNDVRRWIALGRPKC